MTIEDKKNACIALGRFLKQFPSIASPLPNNLAEDSVFYEDFLSLITSSISYNGWFTPEQVCFALQSWADALTEDQLTSWLSRYDFSEVKPKTVALILAGNIPLVGFHDFLCVLLSGHKVQVKTSSNDPLLLPFLAKYLIHIAPELADKISFAEGKLDQFDAVIATGSNNTARYFDYYFKDKPSIIRKNRNSVAVLTGAESAEQLALLGEDIFRYFGLGCRNVSKLFVPKSYSFTSFFEAIFPYQTVLKYEKYVNNYDYNKAVFLMSDFKLLDNGFLTLKEDTAYSSPISSVFYEYYDDLETVTQKLAEDHEKIQCIVSNQLTPNTIAFGQTQQPKLWDYADNVDTISFLTTI